MVEAKMDRRVQKTRQALQNALIALILEKGYDSVMVQDILDRANVGRSTFYAHYQDKEDLLMGRFESLQKAFEAHFQIVIADREENNEKGTTVNLPLFMLRYVENEHQLFKALLGKQGSGKHAGHIQQFLLKYTRDIVKAYAQAPLSPHQFEIIAQYMTSAFLSLLVWWVDRDMPCSVEELNTFMMRLMEPGLKDVLEVSALWS
ncbi:MAG: TetR/AcrR family transcriptional regulator [Chloroflexota bacterium]